MKKPLLFCVLLLTCLVANSQAKSCAAAFFSAISGPNAANMIMSTGKWINDLGDFEVCQGTQGLRYGALGIKVRPIGKIYLGMCLPSDCQAHELDPLVDAVVASNKKQFISGDFVFADEANVPLTPLRVIGFIVFSFLAIVYVVGFLTEFTPLFNKPGVREASEDTAKDKTILGKAFISFSPARNIRKLFYSPFNSKDPLRVLNGVRVLSMLYVILGHAYYNVLLVPTANINYINTLVQPLWWQPIPGGFFAVDVFFYLSAFLGAYMMLGKFEKKKCLNFPMIYFHRFYRLAPNVFLMILFAVTFFAYFGNGPIWHDQRERWIKDCPRTFWAYITFINSLWPGENNACVGWLWYLSHDFIFFLTLPFQVFIYYRSKIAAYGLAMLLLAFNFGIVVFITLRHEIGTSMLVTPEAGKFLYYKPWARLGSYQVGIFMGYFYYEYMKGDKPDGNKNTLGYKFYKTVQISTILRWVYYVLGLGFILWAVFIVTPDNRLFLTQKRYWGMAFSAFYNAICRPLYVFGLHLILMGPIVGKGEFLQFFLGSRFWAPWAKVAFYSYLVHLFVFTWFFGQMRQSVFLNHKTIIWSYFGVIFLSIFVATFLSVLFEAPWMQLEKMVLFPPRKKREDKVKEQEPEIQFNAGLQEKAFDNEFSETFDTSDNANNSDLKRRNKETF